MRRMITTGQAKVLNNFAVNEDGTVVEVGGNIAFESIEQLGFMDTSERVVGGYFWLADKPGAGSNIILARNITKVEVLSGRVDEVTGVTCDEGVLMYSSKEVSFVYKLNGVIYRFNRQDNPKMNVYGDIAVKTSAGIINGYQDIKSSDPEFKPFFTEEQYQELLDLIA